MPTATSSIIQIYSLGRTSGLPVVTIDLLAGTSFELSDAGWGPQVAPRRTDDMGGAGAYDDVDEEFNVNVVGATATAVLANLAALSQLLDEAEDWNNGGDVDPVFVRVLPKGSTRGNTAADALQAIVLGRSRDALLTMPATFADHLVSSSVEETHIRIRRRGTWTAQTATLPTPSSATVVASLMTCGAAPAQAVPAPLFAQIGGLPYTVVIPAGVFLVAPANRFFIVEAEGLVTTKWTDVAEASGSSPYARSGHILRYTPTDTLPSTSAYLTLGGSTFFKDVAVYAVVRNNSTTTTWQLHANLSSESLGFLGSSVPTRDITIDTTTQNPQVVCLGAVSHSDACRQISLTATALTVSGTLDIDYIVVIATPDAATNILSHEPIDATGYAATAALVVDPITAALTPIVKLIGGGTLPVSYHGDPFFQSTGTSIAGMWLACGGLSAANWRCATAAGVVTTILTAQRLLTALVPA